MSSNNYEADRLDPAGVTSILAAQLLMNSIGFIFHARHGEAV